MIQNSFLSKLYFITHYHTLILNFDIIIALIELPLLLNEFSSFKFQLVKYLSSLSNRNTKNASKAA